MALVIVHNLMADIALRNFSQTYKALAESVNRLSSGLRVNNASDDAAGLAIRESLRADVAALAQGIRNANDAISMLQTFDGAAQVIDEKLIRMKELAEQAATGTYSSAQRRIMQSEFDQMRQEIDRIANATKFNGIYGLNSTGSIKIHFGPGNSSTEDFYYVQSKNLTASALGILTLDISAQAGAQSALTVLNSAITAKDTGRAQFGYMMNRLENTVTNLTIEKENYQAAESQISDADIASEMATLTRSQVLAQAGIAMLVQASNVPRLALALLAQG
jgi:flagellin